MAIQMNLWSVDGDTLTTIEKAQLDTEDRLESWLAKDLVLLGVDLLLIGRQVATDFGGRIDLLCIDRQGDIVILELKRDRTPRDIVAQMLDYASWVRNLDYEQISGIAANFLGKSLAEAFRKYYDEPLPESVNSAHSMIVIASEFDESSERIVEYLTDEYKVNINVVFFSFFRKDTKEFLGRAWLRDPEQTSATAIARKRSPWSGFWFVNVGEGPHRNWDDNRKYGFLSAGQGGRASRALKRLKTGDRIFAYMGGRGYVGFGEVMHEAVMIKEFLVEPDGKKLLQIPLAASSAGDNQDNPEMSEWAVKVKWLKMFTRDDARTFKGAFANQNVVCELRHIETVQFLEREFDTGIVR